MRHVIALLAALLGFASASSAWALDEQGVGPTFNLGGGVSFPLGETAGALNTGGNFTGGIGYNFNRNFGVLLDYMYSWYGLESDLLEGTQFDGDSSMQYGNLNVIASFTPADSRIGVYAIGGPGLYYRRVRITEFEGTAVAPYCDPWLLYCSPTAVSVESVVGSRSSTDFGVNIGAGVNVMLAGGLARLYLEARYHYIWGPSFDTPSGETKSANGQYLPVVLGLRF